MKKHITIAIVLGFLSLLTVACFGQTNGDLIVQYKGGSGAATQFLTPSNTALLGFNGANPNRLEAIPRSTFTTPAQVAAGYQPLNGNLSTLAGVTPGTLGLNLLASANAPAARSWLGLGISDTPTFFGLIVADNANDYPLFKLSSVVGSAVVSIENMTDDRVFYLPDVNGTLLTEDGNGASLTALNASNIASGSLALARIAQGGATSGQALVWNGSTWAPGTVSAPVTSVAGRTGAITLSNSDISGLGTMATQNANNVTITGGSITGASVVSLGATSNTFWLADANTVLIANTSLAARYTGTERLWVQGGIGFASSYASNLQAYLILRGANSLGMGLASGTPAVQYLGGQDATGTNIAGGAFYLRSGNGTGTGGSGSIIFQTAPTGSSGSTANTMTTRLEITKEGYIKVSGLPTSSAGLPSGVLWNNANTVEVVP